MIGDGPGLVKASAGEGGGKSGWPAQATRAVAASGRPCSKSLMLPRVVPGQYVSVFANLPDGNRQPRQYTVSSTALGNRLQITVRRVRGVNGAPDGQVSSFLHDVVGSFRQHAQFPTIGGTAPDNIPGIGWSDHWSFWMMGYPAIMITDTALFRNPFYHTPQDTPDKLDYARMARVVHGMTHVVRALAN